MRKKTTIRFLTLCLALVLGVGLFAEQPIELLVDMHGWMPTLNTVPTLESPKVLNAPRLLAQEFERQTGIKIKWAYSKPVGGLEDEMGQWFTTQIAGDSCPVIAFSWGSRFQDRNYYVDLTEIMNRKNEFVEGNEVWKDMYEPYLFAGGGGPVDARGRIVSVPISLYPGPFAGYYYNMEIFEEHDISIPATFEQLIDTSKEIQSHGYTGIAPWGHFKKYGLDQWVVQNTIGVPIAAKIIDQLDLDGDGRVSTLETLKAVYADKFSPQQHDYAKEVYIQAKRYFTEALPAGWLDKDYMNEWDMGKIGMKEEGLWALNDEYNRVSRDYDFGIFPATLLSTDTTPYAAEMQMTQSGPFEPMPDLQLNIMKPAVDGNPELLEAAVKFLMFLTVPENVTMLCEEQGAALGAVIGSGYNSVLDDYLGQPFPIVPQVSWPMAFTSAANDTLNRRFGLWVLGERTDAQFYADVDEYQKAGADALVAAMGLTI